MKVTNPTLTTLTVNWNPADGNVQGYKVIYVPEDGGEEVVVRSLFSGFQTNVRPKTRVTEVQHHTLLTADKPSRRF